MLTPSKLNEIKNYCSKNSTKSESVNLLKTPDEFLPFLNLEKYDLILTAIFSNQVRIKEHPIQIRGHQIAFISILKIDNTYNLLAYYSKTN